MNEREKNLKVFLHTPNQCFSLTDTFGCSEEALTVAAMLQVQHVFTQPSRAKAAAVSNYTEFSQLHTCTCSMTSVGPLGYILVLACNLQALHAYCVV